jgi:hypothetical protein
MIRLAFALCAFGALAAPTLAQDSPAASGIVSLTPEQREAALEAGAARAKDDSLQYGGSDRRVHGELGVEVGSRSERAIYGTMVAPLGQNGMAAISYGTGQGPRWRRHGRFHDDSSAAQLSGGMSSHPAPAPADAETINPD